MTSSISASNTKNKMKTIKTGTMYRSCEVARAAVDEEKRTVELSFSSEEPVERHFGFEVLDHEEKSVDLSRLKSGAPLLVEHSREDQVGVIEKAWVDEEAKKGRATVRFGKSARAQEIFQDVVDGIRGLVSVGYMVNRMVTEKVEESVETLRAVSWMPMEVSIVSVPADTSVGIGRTEQSDAHDTVIEEKAEPMKRVLLDPQAGQASGGGGAAPTPPAPAAGPSIEVIRAEARKSIAEDNKEIQKTVEQLKARFPQVESLGVSALAGELDLKQFRAAAWEVVRNDKPTPVQTNQGIGMDESDIRRFSWQKAIVQAAEGKLDGLERACHEQAIKQYGMKAGANSVIIPFDVLNYSKRDQLAATGTLGGNVVSTDLLAGSFIDQLRARMMVARLGATMLPGLQGIATIPRQTAGAATTWAASEAATAAEASVLFDQVTLTPRQIASHVQYSWLLLQQSTPAIDGLIQQDFQNGIAQAIDTAALHGIGSSGQPTGVAVTSGIGSVEAGDGTQGGALAWADIVNLEAAVAVDNADVGALAYLTNSTARGWLKRTLKGATTATDGIYIWPDGPHQDGFQTLGGYRAGVSNNVAANLTIGTSTTVASAVFFGDWSSLLIGMWSGLEILTDPYTNANARLINIHGYQAVDVAVRHAESFAGCLDAIAPA